MNWENVTFKINYIMDNLIKPEVEKDFIKKLESIVVAELKMKNLLNQIRETHPDLVSSINAQANLSYKKLTVVLGKYSESENRYKFQRAKWTLDLWYYIGNENAAGNAPIKGRIGDTIIIGPLNDFEATIVFDESGRYTITFLNDSLLNDPIEFKKV